LGVTSPPAPVPTLPLAPNSDTVIRPNSPVLLHHITPSPPKVEASRPERLVASFVARPGGKLAAVPRCRLGDALPTIRVGLRDSANRPVALPYTDKTQAKGHLFLRFLHLPAGRDGDGDEGGGGGDGAGARGAREGAAAGEEEVLLGGYLGPESKVEAAVAVVSAAGRAGAGGAASARGGRGAAGARGPPRELAVTLSENRMELIIERLV
jgi:hypothetical protein